MKIETVLLIDLNNKILNRILISPEIPFTTPLKQSIRKEFNKVGVIGENFDSLKNGS